MAGQEIARREQGVGLSPVLAEAGVQVQESEDGRFRSISFPRDLAEHVNVLLPVQELVQADPNYTPTIRAVQLNPDKDGPHFYNQGGRLAPRKQALETLADVAGMRVARCRPMRKAELDAYPDGTIGYEATVMLRRSDGTPQEITRHKIWDPEVERYRIVQEVKTATTREGAKRFAEGAPEDAEIRKRLLQEKQFAPQKTESKAVLRAIRAALQIPHTFTAQDAAKPFLVVGYSFTPDYTDPEVRRLLVEYGLGVRTEEVYGRAALAPGDVGIAPESEAPEEAPGTAPPAPAAEEEPPGGGAPPEAATEPERGPAPAAFEGAEPPPPGAPAPEPAGGRGSEEEAAPGAYVLPAEFTRYAGQTIAHVAEEAKDSEYLAWLCSDKVQEPTRSAARRYVEAQGKGS